ncbi:MAG: hypothetical protein CMF50_00850 [Legionellales bacterium]|nr:hypothetical protein [Legionellales bacterium]|tara:strand:+ start:33747 stop:37535 length:3789 start_codon:yes stop_codon:yes gene_type:complete
MFGETTADYYAVLGIDPDASTDTIKKAYHQKAVKTHPDKNPGDAKAAEEFKQISAAYDVLSNSAKRAEYDATRSLSSRLESIGRRDIGIVVTSDQPTAVSEANTNPSDDLVSAESTHHAIPPINVSALISNARLSGDALVELASGNREFGLALLDSSRHFDSAATMLRVFYTVFEKTVTDVTNFERFKATAVVKYVLSNLSEYLLQLVWLLQTHSNKDAILRCLWEKFSTKILTLDTELLVSVARDYPQLREALFNEPHVTHLSMSHVQSLLTKPEERRTYLAKYWTANQERAAELVVEAYLLSGPADYQVWLGESCGIDPVAAAAELGYDRVLALLENDNCDSVAVMTVLLQVALRDTVEKSFETHSNKLLPHFIRLINAFEDNPLTLDKQKTHWWTLVTLAKIINEQPESCNTVARHILDEDSLKFQEGTLEKEESQNILFGIILSQYFLKNIASNVDAQQIVKDYGAWRAIDAHASENEDVNLPESIWRDFIVDELDNIDGEFDIASISGARSHLATALQQLKNTIELDVDTYTTLVEITGFYQGYLEVKAEPTAAIAVAKRLADSHNIYNDEDFATPLIFQKSLLAAIQTGGDLKVRALEVCFNLLEKGCDLFPADLRAVDENRKKIEVTEQVDYEFLAALLEEDSGKFANVYSGYKWYLLSQTISDPFIQPMLLEQLRKIDRDTYNDGEPYPDTLAKAAGNGHLLQTRLGKWYQLLSQNEAILQKIAACEKIKDILTDITSFDPQELVSQLIISGMCIRTFSTLNETYKHHPEKRAFIIAAVALFLSETTVSIPAGLRQKLQDLLDQGARDNITPEEHYLCYTKLYLTKHKAVPGDKLVKLQGIYGQRLAEFITPEMEETMATVRCTNQVVANATAQYTQAEENFNRIIEVCQTTLKSIFEDSEWWLMDASVFNNVNQRLREIPQSELPENLKSLLSILTQSGDKPCPYLLRQQFYGQDARPDQRLPDQRLLDLLPDAAATELKIFISDEKGENSGKYTILIEKFITHQYFYNFMRDVYEPCRELKNINSVPALHRAVDDTLEEFSDKLVEAVKDFTFEDNTTTNITEDNIQSLNKVFHDKCTNKLSNTQRTVAPRYRGYFKALLGALIAIPLIVTVVGAPLVFSQLYKQTFFNEWRSIDVTSPMLVNLNKLKPDQTTQDNISEQLTAIPFRDNPLLCSSQKKKDCIATLPDSLKKTTTPSVAVTVEAWLDTTRDSGKTNRNLAFFPRRHFTRATETKDSPCRRLIDSLAASKMRLG